MAENADKRIKNRILLLGGGGHFRSVLDSLMSLESYDEIGIIDRDTAASVPGVHVVGTDDDLPRLREAGWQSAFITVGSVGATGLRRKLFALAKEAGFLMPSIIDRTAIIARGTMIGEGVFVGKRAVVNFGSVIGDGAIVNTGAIVEHDCAVGAFAHISPGAVLCGQVAIGADTHVGAGSVIRQGIRIGGGSLIGAGSVVVKDVPDHVTAYGNPCRVVG